MSVPLPGMCITALLLIWQRCKINSPNNKFIAKKSDNKNFVIGC